MFTHKTRLALLTTLLLLCFGQALAADITVKYRDAQSPGVQIINLTGKIHQEDGKRFKQALAKRGDRNVYIVLKLRGGNFYTALKMANEINKINRQGGNIDTSSIYCHSACFFIASAGKKKWVLFSKHVFGVHFPYHQDRSPLKKGEYRHLFNKQVNSLVASGISKQQAIEIVKKSETGSPDRTINFTRKELVALGFTLI